MRAQLDPKSDLINSGRGEAHTELANSQPVKTGLESAFTYFCLCLNAETPEAKGLAFAQIEGARRFIDVFLNLGRKVEVPTKELRDLKRM